MESTIFKGFLMVMITPLFLEMKSFATSATFTFTEFAPAITYDKFASDVGLAGGMVATADGTMLLVSDPQHDRILQVQKNVVLPLEADTTLHAPTGLAIDHKGQLWVGEGNVNGRLFRADHGQSTPLSFKEVPTPWKNQEHGFTHIIRSGTSLVTGGYKKTPPQLLSNGWVGKRDLKEKWTMIDHGIFARFANSIGDPEGRFLILAEQTQHDIVCYDTQNKSILATLSGIKGVHHLILLNDGTVLAVATHEDGTWKLLELDFVDKKAVIWIDSLPPIISAASDPVNHQFFLATLDHGDIYRFRTPKNHEQAYVKLHQLKYLYAMVHAPDCNNWPEFFKPWVEELGAIKPVDLRSENHNSKNVSFAIDATPVSIKDMVNHMPFVAGKYVCTPADDDALYPNPISDLSFVIFSPQAEPSFLKNATPRTSFLRLRYKDGKQYFSTFMHHLLGQTVDEKTPANELPDVWMGLPNGYVLPPSAQKPNHYKFLFAGMGLDRDYMIEIDLNQPHTGTLWVEYPNKQKISYTLTAFPDRNTPSGYSIFMAFEPPSPKGWVPIGNQPLNQQLVLDHTSNHLFRHSVQIAPSETNSFDDKNILHAGLSDLTWVNWAQKLMFRAVKEWQEVHF